MDKKLIAKVKQAVAVARQQSTGRGRVRYSEFVRNSVRDLVGAGLKKSELSSLIDVGVPTILKWSKEEMSNYRRIEVLPETKVPVAEGFVIILPSGVRIECESPALLKSILEVLQ